MRKHVNRIYPFRPPLNKCFITRFLSAKSPYRTTVIGDCLTKKNPRSKISSHNPFILYIVNTFFYFLHFSSPLKFAKKDWLLTCSRICQVWYRKSFLSSTLFINLFFCWYVILQAVKMKDKSHSYLSLLSHDIYTFYINNNLLRNALFSACIIKQLLYGTSFSHWEKALLVIE
jgi:hypothetical protein